MKSGRWLMVLGSFVLLVLLAQLVPYGRQHVNPAAGTPVAFDTPETQRLAERACFDCHSNRTRWPWYASIAPVSWLVQRDVDEGREKLDFTAFDPRSEHVADAVKEAAETVTKNEMPLWNYGLMHPEARLTAAERRRLADGLTATFAPFRVAAGERGETGERGEDESRD